MAKTQAIADRMDLTKEQREAMVESLRVYFKVERDEDVGHLAAELLLGHILRDIGPHIYNAGVRDAARYVQLKLEDIAEVEIYPPEKKR